MCIRDRLEKGQRISRKDITRRLVEILYERNDVDFRRGTFRVRGDVIEIYPTYDELAYRIELFGDEIESLSQIDPLFGTVKQRYSQMCIRDSLYWRLRMTIFIERQDTGLRLRFWFRWRRSRRGRRGTWLREGRRRPRL